MPNVFLRPGELVSILQAIEISTTFYEACKSQAKFESVVEIFDDALLAQKILHDKIQNILANTPKE